MIRLSRDPTPSLRGRHRSVPPRALGCCRKDVAHHELHPQIYKDASTTPVHRSCVSSFAPSWAQSLVPIHASPARRRDAQFPSSEGPHASTRLWSCAPPFPPCPALHLDSVVGSDSPPRRPPPLSRLKSLSLAHLCMYTNAEEAREHQTSTIQPQPRSFTLFDPAESSNPRLALSTPYHVYSTPSTQPATSMRPPREPSFPHEADHVARTGRHRPPTSAKIRISKPRRDCRCCCFRSSCSCSCSRSCSRGETRPAPAAATATTVAAIAAASTTPP